MKLRHHLCSSLFPALAVISLSVPSLFAANIVQTGSDSAGANSFTTGTNFPGGAPVNTNTYQTGAFRFRTISSNASNSFGGISLEIQAGLGFRNKSSGTTTVNNLIVANNGVLELSQPNNVNGAGSVGTLAGNITLNGTGIIMAGNSTDSAAHVYTIRSTITGSGGITTGNAAVFVNPPTNNVSASSIGTVILTGDNSFSGGTNSNGLAGSKLQLGNANAVKNSTVTSSIAGGLTFGSGIGTFNLGGLAGSQNITLTDTASAAVTLNVGGGINNNSSTYDGILSGTGAKLTKSGTGTQTFSGANTYAGTTEVNAGKLIINGNQSTATGNVTVGGSGTLGGSGTVGGATSVSSGGVHSVGLVATGGVDGVGKQTFSSSVTYNTGSIFEWNLAVAPSETGRGTSYDAVNAASLGVTTGAIFRVVLDGTQDFSSAFWDVNRTWSDIFKTEDGGSNLSIASIFSGTVQYYNGGGTTLASIGAPTAQGAFTFSGTDLKWTAVPEPTSALAGLLITAGLLRRRRTA